jgi:hypothetical protein
MLVERVPSLSAKESASLMGRILRRGKRVVSASDAIGLVLLGWWSRAGVDIGSIQAGPLSGTERPDSSYPGAGRLASIIRRYASEPDASAGPSRAAAFPQGDIQRQLGNPAVRDCFFTSSGGKPRARPSGGRSQDCITPPTIILPLPATNNPAIQLSSEVAGGEKCSGGASGLPARSRWLFPSRGGGDSCGRTNDPDGDGVRLADTRQLPEGVRRRARRAVRRTHRRT